MIRWFERGKFYRFTGNQRPQGWNPRGEMDFVLDNQPHLCIDASVYCAIFKDDPRKYDWHWGDPSFWEEVSGNVDHNKENKDDEELTTNIVVIKKRGALIEKR